MHIVYFSNPPLKEQPLTLNNNLPPLLLSNCFCLDIKHPHCTTVLSSGCTGLKGNFVTNSSVTNSLFGCGDGGTLWKHSMHSQQEDASMLYGWRLVRKRSKVLLVNRVISLASPLFLPSTLYNSESCKTKLFNQKFLQYQRRNRALWRKPPSCTWDVAKTAFLQKRL